VDKIGIVVIAKYIFCSNGSKRQKVSELGKDFTFFCKKIYMAYSEA
jgi:hypothetical protein